MATAPKFRLKQIPTDVWSIREKLCLASSVLRSGDQNWVSVSRAIKPYGEANRPPDWFSQKNCAIQYSDLLEKVETPKRKRGDRADVETPGNLIVRKLTIERIEELKRLINEEQQRHRKLRQEVDSVRSGSIDERLEEVWNRIQEEIKLKTIAETTHHKWLQEREARIAAIKNAPKTLGKAKRLYPKQTRLEEVRRNSSQSEQSEQESALDSPLSEPLSIEYLAQVEDASSPLPTASHPDSISSTTKSSFPNIPVSTPVPSHGSQTSSTSPLLTSLLKSPAPTTAISPTTGSMLTSPVSQPKEGTLPSTQASPRASTTPQPFFDPSCALATAAARQLAVATAPSPTPSSVESLFVRDRSQFIGQLANIEDHIHPLQGTQSATASAPTLSKLLELPPGVPGKLPPLPIIQPEQTVSSTLQSSTVSTVTITTATPASALASTNVVSVVTPETTVVNPSDVVPSLGSVSTVPTDDTEQLVNKALISHHDVEVKVKVEPKSPIIETNEEESEETEIKANIAVKVEETDSIVENSEEGKLEEKSDKICAKEEIEQEGKEVLLTKAELIEQVTEEVKESSTDILSECERTEPETVGEQQEATETETEGSPPETTDSETMAETNVEELVLSKEDITESADENGKENLNTEPPAVIAHNEESRTEETVSDEQVSENLVATEDENLPTENEKKSVWEKPEIVEKEDMPTSPESVKPVEEETKVVRKTSGKRGRKPKSKPGKLHSAEESDESTRDKKDDDNSNASSLLEKEITAKHSDINSKHEKVKETPPATPKSELLIQQQSESSEQSLMETRRKPTLSVSESIPNSPASTSQSDDQDNAKDYRTWKKAIMLVWNAAANHKFANTFLHPVTDDVAPGYHSIVYRPMDLSAIKKNIETGAIKSTLEFQRDMMLMFQNAVMYNSSDHDVFHMAVEMQKEVMEHIQDFLATQLMVQTADTKVLRGREREREKKSEGDKDDVKRKHPFSSDSESKSKKRRIRE